MTKNYLLSKNEELCTCPCKKCVNRNPPTSLAEIEHHLFTTGMAGSYKIWVLHGEEDNPTQNQSASSHDYVFNDGTTHSGNNTGVLDMLHDADNAGPFDSQADTGRHGETNDDSGEADSTNNLGESSTKFEELLGKAKQELYPGCTDYSSLTFLVELMHLKVLNCWSNKSFEMQLELLKKSFPKDNTIPSSYYEAKNILRDLGLGYESIDACKNDCALYWKEHKDRDDCPVCHEPRYKFNDGKGKKIPHKVLRYFPLKPRLQRLFASRHTADDMRWHKEHVAPEGVLRHPADAEAWKHFDLRYPQFAEDPRNVRLGLATDGFNPFGNMNNAYSMWPVIVMPYNLPPWKCMKQLFFMMALLIPGKKAPGWSTKGYLACPVCNDDPPSRALRSKIGYLHHRRFLPPQHPWRRNKLHDGHDELHSPPKELTGIQLLQQIEKLGDKSCFGKHPDKRSKQRSRTKKELSWTKKSIFYELPYWSHLKIRHKIDVMHVEKNICDNIVGTLLNQELKTKDTFKARLDLEDMNIRPELHLKRKGEKFIKPPASYALTTEQRKEFCRFLKSVKFPDGYASNIARSANVDDGKVSGLKSHDCHVLLQKILPVGIRSFLPTDVCTSLIELSSFFHDLCAKKLNVSHLEEMEKGIVLILCKLERIFPPAFFDVMVHLAIHLPREAKLVGPVGYSWMYPIERYLGTLKRYVKNKARPEGSIAEAYIINEALTFCSLYLRGIETKFNRPERNDDNSDDSQRRKGKLSVFAQDVRPFASKSFLIYLCQYIEHLNVLKAESNDNLLQRHQKLFPVWFRNRIGKLYHEKFSGVSDELHSLAQGVESRAKSFSACIYNGVRFHTKQRELRRTTQNSGLVVDGEHNSKPIEFFGSLQDVIELDFLYGYRVVLFKCDWFDVTPGNTRIRKDYSLTCINTNRIWYKSDPFVLASQSQQVFYLDDYKHGANWKVVQKMHHRHIWDVPEMDINEVQPETETTIDEAYHHNKEAPLLLSAVREDDNEATVLYRDVDVELKIIDADLVLAEDVIDDDEDEEEEDETLFNYNNDVAEPEDIVPEEDDSDLEY
ncbi:uncharacterized protein LOC113348969 [Papaver somniferum]|uniref:uncharacterized protein LOC113348969 n=1 Tax=Papaver somniferum TaxID=3469 RepID=UPI000E6FD334|nr:uncharacterized protein LOC113348969 [Papaver somniferum]